MDPKSIRNVVTALSARGAGRRYPPEIRSAAAAFAQQQRQADVDWLGIAAELGIPAKTVQRWTEVGSRATALVPVRIKPPPVRSPLQLRLPSGAILEGLDVDTAVAVLRALG